MSQIPLLVMMVALVVLISVAIVADAFVWAARQRGRPWTARELAVRVVVGLGAGVASLGLAFLLLWRLGPVGLGLLALLAGIGAMTAGVVSTDMERRQAARKEETQR